MDCIVCRDKMKLELFSFLLILMGKVIGRPSNVQDGLISEDDNEVFVMKKTDLKEGWCKTRTLRQTIRVAGCLPVTVLNNYCYGQCNSFYIPSHSSEEPLFKSCTSCVPQRSFIKTVTLQCPLLPINTKKHSYLYSKRCRCTST